jgi:type II secretory pathway pseudopilin PulG
VITILAILWTIAFVSLQWYTKKARDSNRTNDIWLIMKALELYQIKTWEYPLPDYGTVVYYETWSNEVWTQWTVWIETVKKLDKLDKVPRDPLTWTEYAYSRLNTKKEYQVAAALEWWAVSSINLDNNKRPVSIETGLGKLIPQANASSSIPGTAYVKWNYNGQIAKVQSWTKTYVLAVPTIINWDMTLTDIIDILNDKRLVYDWYSNLPDSYKNTNFVIDWWFDYSQTWWIVVFSWSINDLKKDENDRVLMIKNMQDYYKDTIIKDNDNIKNIVDLNIDLLNPSEWLKDLAKETVENNLNESVKEDYWLVDIWEELWGWQEPMIEPILTIWWDSTNTSMNYLLAERPASQTKIALKFSQKKSKKGLTSQDWYN